jgi:hypothetical protein
MKPRRYKSSRDGATGSQRALKRPPTRVWAYAATFVFGALLATGATLVLVSKVGTVGLPDSGAHGMRYVEPPPERIIDPNLVDPETHTVRKWHRVGSLDELLKLPPQELEKIDIAEMNLLCASGLPGAEGLEIPKLLLGLDGWAASVRFQTNRHLYRVSDPTYADHYKHSENVLRAEFLVQVLQEDCGVHYNLERVRDLDFTNSKDLFIHGLSGANGGTCASLPVLYVAIGRRLGYPMSLALAPVHVLARWDGPDDSNDPMKHFNVEASGYGFKALGDDFYLKWPRMMTDAERNSGYFLRPLTGAEMLGEFLTMRGHCLMDTGRLEEAKSAYQLAQKLIPKCPYAGNYVREAELRTKAREYAKAGMSAATQPKAHRPHVGDPVEELERIAAMNGDSRGLAQRRAHIPRPPWADSPPPLGTYAPQPGVAQPYQPYQQPPVPGLPPM